jgi:voltage-gated potassium channel
MTTIEGGADQNPDTTTADSRSQRSMLRWQAAASVVRSAVVIVVACCLYTLAPLGRRLDPAGAVQLAGWLLAFTAVVAWELRAVIRSGLPGLRAIEAVAVCVPLFLMLFAATYFVDGRHDPAGFSEPLTRLDALYFTVTIFATVGFGDITPRSAEARGLVTAQMLADLVLIGFIAKVLFGLARRRRHALAVDATCRTGT